MSPVVRSDGPLSAVVGLAVALVATGATGEVGPARHVKASLLADVNAVRPGQPLTLGIRLEMENGWHTYWRNPGDSGLPTRVRWELPLGFAAGELRWPYPTRFKTGPLVSYGYETDVLLPVEVRVPPSIDAPEVHLAARVDWLECQEACVPGRCARRPRPVRRPPSSPRPAAGCRRRPLAGASPRLPRPGDWASS